MLGRGAFRPREGGVLPGVSFFAAWHSEPDTFGRVFRLLDPIKFHACFLVFIRKFSETIQGVIAIDGKTLRRSFDRASQKSALHLVSAWAADQWLVLGQLAVDGKSNEITAVPKLLELLSLKGAIVTADALNCQRAIATQIVDQGGDYVLAQACGYASSTYHAAALARRFAPSERQAPAPSPRTTATTAELPENGAFILAPMGLDPRACWGIENSLHWVLDVTMNEDQSRNRKDHSPENLTLLRRLALNLAKLEPSKGSMKGKLKQAGWDNAFLAKLLAQFAHPQMR